MKIANVGKVVSQSWQSLSAITDLPQLATSTIAQKPLNENTCKALSFILPIIIVSLH